MTPHTRRHHLAGGLTLVADHWGEPSDDAVLFLHGGGQTRHSWGGTARAMATAGRYAVTLDMRGHGESDWTDEGEYQLSTFADDAAAVIADLGVRPALVGASLGGMTGVLLEGDRHPGSISALVLVDIIPRMNPAGADRVKQFMLANAKTGFGSLEEVADAVSAYNPHRPRPSDLEGLKKNLRFRDGRWYWHWDPRFIEMGMSEPTREVRDPELMSTAMAAISTPVLLVRGRMSDLVTEEGAAAFQREYPGARYVDVSGAGHMVAGDKNDVFTSAVADFLDEI
ncbi:MAG: alpha/beta hydrolase [Actinomycetota bacterium]